MFFRRNNRVFRVLKSQWLEKKRLSMNDKILVKKLIRLRQWRFRVIRHIFYSRNTLRYKVNELPWHGYCRVINLLS